MSNENIIKNKDEIIKELARAGAQYGCSRARRHPSALSWVFGFKSKTAIIDLEKTVESLERAKDFIREVASAGKQVLFVGTKSEAKEAVRRGAAQIGMPFVDERWIGGTFTNFVQIRKRIDRMQDLKDKEKKGELSVYTKKERSLINKEISDLERYFLSISDMVKLPGAMVVVDSDHERLAVDESLRLNIPVVSISGSDCDVRKVTYPIVANDSARDSIVYLINQLVEAYKEGKKNISVPQEAKKEE